MHLVVDAVHRRNQRHGDEADDQAHEDDDGGLKEAREALDPDVDLSVVVLGGQLELLVERSGLFADSEHWRAAPGKSPRSSDRACKALALHHLLSYLGEAPLIDGVVGRRR